MTATTAFALALLLAQPSPSPDPALLEAARLFDPSRLLVVDIEIPEADWKTLCAQTRRFTDALRKEPAPSPFTEFRGSITIDGVRIESVGMRKKGFIGSLDSERPSLKINFSGSPNRERISGLDTLTLNNNKQDEPLVRQILAYRMFARAGLPAPRCSLASVRVNGVDLGIYSNVESIRRPFLARAFGDGSGELFEGTLADFFPDRLARFESKSKPATPEGEADRTVLARVAEILSREGELALDELGRVMDIDAFLRFWAVESLIGFWDGYTNNQNNFFVYRRPGDGRLQWIPWGADGAFSHTPFFPFLPQGPASVRAQSVVAHRLFAHAATRERYRETITDILENLWSEDDLIAECERVEALVREFLHPRQKDASQKLAPLRRFILGRRAEVLTELASWPVEVARAPRIPVHLENVGSAAGTFSTMWRGGSLEDPRQGGKAALELVLDGKVVTFSSLAVRAEPSRPGPGDPAGAGPKLPSIVFTGERASDRQSVTLAVTVATASFRPQPEASVPVEGVLVVGNGFFGFRFVTGDVTLKAAEESEGSAVEGSLRVELGRIVQPR